jgi:two-component system, OmpR family, copper resistance phosphate regulon response regulator CusR
MRILVVEDDPRISDVVRRGLEQQHYSVDCAIDGTQGLEMALTNDYDLLILDLMLPGIDGKTLCRRIRSNAVATPILMLTAIATTESEVEGLDIGADDYLTKPFDFVVLNARIRSLIRRQTEHRTATISIADLEIDTANRTATRGGRPLNLTAKVFSLLEFMALNRGRIVSRAQIAEHVWDMNFDPRSNVIESLMHALRQRVDRGRDLQLIHTIRGLGYRLDERNGEAA